MVVEHLIERLGVVDHRCRVDLRHHLPEGTDEGRWVGSRVDGKRQWMELSGSHEEVDAGISLGILLIHPERAHDAYDLVPPLGLPLFTVPGACGVVRWGGSSQAHPSSNRVGSPEHALHEVRVDDDRLGVLHQIRSQETPTCKNGLAES